MAIDTRYIPAFSIETVLLDKDTGQPLSGGLVYFEQDNNRGTLKPVYQITGTEPDYTFVQMTNPVVLSSIGTFEDSIGNPQIPYFYPFDEDGNEEYYFIRVTSADDVPQFTREHQPYIPAVLAPGEATINYDNELSNPQFATVNFDPDVGQTVSFVGASLAEIDIAPDWTLVASGTGSVIINQETPEGSLNIPTNPGTAIQIFPSGLTSLTLRQRIYGSPNLFGSEWVSGTFTAKVLGSATLNMIYAQSNGIGTTKTIVSKPLTSSYVTYFGNVQIPASGNNQFYPDAYIDIYFNIPIGVTISLTSVQVVGTGSVPVAEIFYDQQSNARQIDHLFHYYKPQLTYKPIPSWLVGWDFPLNPAQPLGSAVPVSSDGASTSRYVWDQTIVFQTVNSSIRISRLSGTQALVLNADVTGQAAIIQYLPNPVVEKVLQSPLSVNVAASRSSGVDIVGTVSLWYTAGTLPDLNTPTFASLVTGLDANGYPTVAGGWKEVPRRNNLGKAQFTLSTRTTREYPDFPFNGWDMEGSVDTATATYFAIVVGTSEILAGRSVEINSVSLCSGDIATRPAPQTPDQVLRECQYYYEKSYAPGVLPGTTNAGNSLYAEQLGYYNSGTTKISVILRGFGFSFKNIKFSNAPDIVFYSPVTGTKYTVAIYLRNSGAPVANTDGNLEIGGTTNWDIGFLSDSAVQFYPKIISPIMDQAGGNNFPEGYLNYHYTIDARLGII